MPEIKKIVLTGGPCAGKTTALVKIIEYFSGMGYKVFTIPEVPTLYSTGGWNYLTPNRELYYEGERAILETQLALEDQFYRLAEVCQKPVLIVCDRGALPMAQSSITRPLRMPPVMRRLTKKDFVWLETWTKR